MDDLPTQQGSGQVLDAQALDALHALDPDGRSQLLRRVLETYRQSLVRLRQQLRQAGPVGDWEQVRLSAHTLKSSSASIGAKTLSLWCAAIEQDVRFGRDDRLALWLNHVDTEADRVDQAVANLLSSLPPLRT